MDEITLFLWAILLGAPVLVALAIWGIRRWLKWRKS
jgi:hypothetical protein